MPDHIKILHCADLHLCAELAFLKNKSKSRRLEVLNTLQNIVKICRSQAIELLIIAGDLFDSNHVDNTIISSVKSMFASIPDVKIAIVAGNHDYYAVDSPYSDDDWSSNVIIFYNNFSMIEFPEKNLRLFGSSFVSSYQNSNKNDFKVPDDNMINIMVYHGDIVTENQESKYNPITIKQIENSGFDYIAMGHIHLATPVLKAKNTFYAYSGTPDGNGFDETDRKGVYIGDVYKHKVNLEFFETSSRIYADVNFDISSLASNTQIAKSILRKLEHVYGDKYAENLYRITLTGKSIEGFLPNPQSISLELASTLYYVSVKNNSRPDTNIQLLASDFSLKGIFVKKMLVKMNACKSEAEKIIYENALYIGLRAFDGEVNFYED